MTATLATPSGAETRRSNQSIDDVLLQMDAVIERCIRERSKLGYFAMLYRDVTANVRDSVKAGHFEDNKRMEKLDIIFASRYLDAIHAFWNKKPTSKSWAVTFQAAALRPPIIMQHLVLGMNTHINLDLAIATAETAPGDLLPPLKNDFQQIMHMLNEMTGSVQDRIDSLSPFFGIIDRVGGRNDEQVLGFAIKTARNLAWTAAEKLARSSGEEKNNRISLHDQVVAQLGKAVLTPGLPLKMALWLIQKKEEQDAVKVINTLKL